MIDYEMIFNYFFLSNKGNVGIENNILELDWMVMFVYVWEKGN